MAFQPGDRIGDYEILEVLGKGGMGQVYKVRNTISDRLEALKVLLPGLEGSADLADRFLREIKVQAKLQHPNIAGLYSAQRIGEQVLMFLEFVEGRTVDQELRLGPIPLARAVDYIRHILNALAYAHSQGVVHRDIKPANMMVTHQGVVKLMDFGIARMAADNKLTQTGSTLGSFYYMSPEQINGEQLDQRADLYSLGISLYEMVTGKLPFPGDSAYSVMAAHLHTEPTPPVQVDPKLPELLNEVILMAIAKQKDRRFQSAQAFEKALASVAAQLGPVPAPDVFAGAGTPKPAVSPDAPTRILSPDSSVHTKTVTPMPAMAAAAAAPQPAVVQSPPPPQAASSRTSNLGLFVAIGLIVVVSAAGIAAWKGRSLLSPQQEEAAPAASTPAPQLQQATPSPSNPAGSLPSPSSPQPAQSEPSSAQVPASPAPASVTPRPGATVPQRSHAPVAAAPAQQMQRVPEQMPTTAPVRSEPPTQPPQQAAIPQQAPPQVSETAMNEMRELYNQLVVRSLSVQEGVGRIEAQQRAMGLGLRGDIVTARTNMGVRLKMAEGALQARDAVGMKKYLAAAEADLEKLEKFLGR